jgi:cell division protease FtsH
MTVDRPVPSRPATPIDDKRQPTPRPRWLRWWWAVALAVLLIELLPIVMGQAVRHVSYSAFLADLEAGRLLSVTVGRTDIHGLAHPVTARGDMSPDTVAFSTTRVDHPTLLDDLRRHGVIVDGADTESAWSIVARLALYAGLMFIMWRLLWRSPGAANEANIFGMGTSRAHVYVEHETRVTFDDVAGVDEAKAELQEIVEFLRDPAAYGRLGARMPRGVLLIGEPGTGKTLLARAVAGESGVPFYFINGSEFVELFVGVGAARVRSLFAKAREHAPCILFIDEIDALGKSRGASIVSGANDEKEQTLNQLLAELDGFDPAAGVVLLAATNRPDTLDPALLRAGRFDRHVLVDRPDRVGRAQILAVHVRRIQLDPALALDAVAAMTPGFTGADLENLVNEAALAATRRGAAAVSLEDFSLAVERTLAGPSRRGRVMSAEDRERTACHEMGHTIVALATPGSDPIQKVSIIPRALGALGFTLQRPIEDRFITDQQALDGKLALLMGGRAAELLVYGTLSTGAAADLLRATELAHDMVTCFGMDDDVGNAVYADRQTGRPFARGPLAVDHDGTSEATRREIDLAVRRRLHLALERALTVLRGHRAQLDEGRRLLATRETLTGEDLATFWRTASVTS